MTQYPMLALFDGQTDKAGGNSDLHEDRIAAEECNKRTHARMGILGWFLPRSIRVALIRRQEQRKLDAAVERLGELSEHLLDDIGMAPETEAKAAPDLETQIAADLAVADPVLSLPVARERRAARTAPVTARRDPSEPQAMAAE